MKRFLELLSVLHTRCSELNPGLDEKLYERAFAIELREYGFSVECQREFPVYYKSHQIGTLIPDMIVEDLIIDAKVVSDFSESHVAQMLGYLNITGLETALLLNFKCSKLGIKRVSNSGR